MKTYFVNFTDQAEPKHSLAMRNFDLYGLFHHAELYTKCNVSTFKVWTDAIAATSLTFAFIALRYVTPQVLQPKAANKRYRGRHWFISVHR